MKRLIINIILISLFILLGIVIVLPFLAEVDFNTGKALEATYRWQRAGEKYQQAVHLNPLNAEYFAKAGDFMLRQSKYREGQERISWHKRAEKLYERACQLNPKYAENWYLLGKTQITQVINRDYTDEGEINRDEVNSAMENFREAIEKDPYNFRNNYLVGYDMFTVWDSLDDADRSKVIITKDFLLSEQAGEL